MGAAFLGLKETGLIDDIQTLKPKTVREVLPQAAHREVYKRNFDAYRKIYRCSVLIESSIVELSL